MEMLGEPAASLGQTLEWLREELAEMQIQDQKLLLTLRHLHSLLEELRAESTHWEDTRPSRNTSPFRARLGSEGRACQPVPRQLTELLRGEKSRRSSLP
uniref:Transmembrane 74B, opposite strand n=1 Tax=Mus spicilegus TaxID=10103 RepID=A0A8C6MXD5_MUSSI